MTAAKNSPLRVERYTVPAASAGERLDRVLAGAWPDLSRSRIQALIREGHVGANHPEAGGETITDPSYRVKPGQAFEAAVPEAAEAVVEAQAIELEIVHEDDDLLVIDKPAGMVVHPGPGRPDATLVNALLAHCGKSLSGIGGVKRPGIVHRLDKDTSGLIVVAKNDTAHQALSRQFQARTIARAYLAVVWGVPAPPVGEIEGNIGRHPKNRKKMTVLTGARGRPALTRYRVLKRADNIASLVECRLATGRTHQIRVHMTHLGHPLVGDPTYGRATAARLKSLSAEAREVVQNLHRQALHARLIGFDHPRTGKPLEFESGLPEDLKIVIDCLNLD
jgi:23S rRNA pseudouridine1911/1915/1917 synthase